MTPLLLPHPKSPLRLLQSSRPNKTTGFTLVEIMIVILIIGILLAIAIPSFVSAREASRARACVASLSQINSAKLQCMMDNKLSTTSTATFSIDGVTTTVPGLNGTFQLTRIGSEPNYLRSVPSCPSNGAYLVGGVNTAPVCSVSTDPSSSLDYQNGGKWYHGF